MVGRGSKRVGGQRRTSKASNGAQGRKPAVPPIIDLEATIVEDGAVGGPGRDAEPPKASAERAETDDAKRGAAAPGPEQTPQWWMTEMKTFFLGGVHVGRWRIPAAGSLLVLGIFAGGLALGYLSRSGDADTGPLRERIAGVEAALRTATAANQALAQRFDALGAKLDMTAEHSRSARAAADAALSEVRSMDAGLQEMARPGSDNDGNGVSTAALQQQLTELAARIEQLAKSAPDGDGVVLSEAVNQRIESLAKTFAELKVSIEQSAARAGELTGTVANDAQALVEATQEQLRGDLAQIETRLNERLAALENSITGSVPTGPSAASVAAGRLQGAVDAGEPYQRELSGLGKILPGDQSFAVLAPHADTGVATIAALITRFDAVAEQLAAPGTKTTDTEGGGDLVSDVLAKVSKLVQVRKTTEPGSRSMSAAVAAARSRIEERDVAGAAKVLEGLGDGLTEDAAKWVEDARARVQVDAAMAELLRRAIMAAPEPEES